MPSKKEVKELNKDLVLAIEWTAAEYKFLNELLQDLEEIGTGKEPLKNLRKASKILRYISRAERRANRFERRVRKKIEELGKEEFALTDFINALREIAKELDVERAHLVNYSSFYDGLLEKELNRAVAEEQLEEEIKKENPQKAQQIHTALLQLVHQIEYQIKDAEKWISALDASLKKAQRIFDRLPDEDKINLQKEGLEILHKYRWAYPDNDKTTIFLAQHPADLEEMVKTSGLDAWYLFGYSLPAVKDLINERTWPMVMVGLVKMMVANGRNLEILLHRGLPAVKDLINEHTWPGLVKMAQAVGEKAGTFFREGLYSEYINNPDLSYNKKKWSEVVELVEKNKGKIRHALYSGQKPTFFKDVNGKLGIVKGKLQKDGSETIVLGGPLLGKAIIRIISDQAFQGWKKAFEAEKVWGDLGFDYVPIEPILKIGGKLRAFKTKEGLWRVSTKVLGPTLKNFMRSGGYETHEELLLMQEKIIDGLNKLKISHGHLHGNNFCIEFHEGKIRLYAIDFDQAVS
ncbi:MAG: hypothetical protein KKA62_03995 [Nanoarchaeota archaeon]|nr:hypothetical protein [Nanoarchaeota archaeon]MBU1643990.1 hypothetical protein [Nanoarchaeota archaeon]MBU1977085.1 hypothetical protein [Nanoarchaeota archaeon]